MPDPKLEQVFVRLDELWGMDECTEAEEAELNQLLAIFYDKFYTGLITNPK